MTQRWKSKLYDDSHSFVSEYGKELIPMLSPKKDEYILDLGCGTGDLSNEIYQYGSTVVGIDNSEEMIKKAKNKYPYIKFLLADATAFKYERPFDAIFSNATLHWVKNADKVLKTVYDSLADQGRFVAEFGGAGNIQLIEESLRKLLKKLGHTPDSPWYFPSIGEYTSKMEEVGFRVVYAAHFDRLTELEEGEHGLRNWVQMFGAYYIDRLPKETVQTILNDLVDDLKHQLFFNGRWHADYKRIRVIGVKE